MKKIKKMLGKVIPFISAPTVNRPPCAITIPIKSDKKDWIFVDKGNYLYKSIPFSL